MQENDLKQFKIIKKPLTNRKEHLKTWKSFTTSIIKPLGRNEKHYKNLTSNEKQKNNKNISNLDKQ